MKRLFERELLIESWLGNSRLANKNCQIHEKTSQRAVGKHIRERSCPAFLMLPPLCCLSAYLISTAVAAAVLLLLLLLLLLLPLPLPGPLLLLLLLLQHYSSSSSE
jgi:hypothetical protein